MSKAAAGSAVPAWMVTFADLMALMMTFFVLLYSFSSIDETKYRMIVQSMAKGFGSALISSKAKTSSIGPPSMLPSPLSQASRARNPTQQEQTARQNEDLFDEIQQSMGSEIAEGIIAVETTGNSVVIRFPEEIAFPPGSDTISDEILPILKRVTTALAKAPGTTIMISGHTDDRPISSARFSSNWELSTDRAVSVIQRIEALGTIDSNRLTAVGYGATRPLVPNDTPEHRARNRRVEIAIVQEQPPPEP